MCRFCVILCGAALLGGCAASAPSGDRVDHAALTAPSGVAVVEPEVVTVELADFGGETVCKERKLPGSRIVVDTVCYTPDAGAAEEPARVQVWSASGASSVTVDGAGRTGMSLGTRSAPRRLARGSAPAP
ncbi:MAG TPA: hypothetical protein VF322_07200 [Gammaproteobacteria bacterium]